MYFIAESGKKMFQQFRPVMLTFLNGTLFIIMINVHFGLSHKIVK